MIALSVVRRKNRLAACLPDHLYTVHCEGSHHLVLGTGGGQVQASMQIIIKDTI